MTASHCIIELEATHDKTVCIYYGAYCITICKNQENPMYDCKVVIDKPDATVFAPFRWLNNNNLKLIGYMTLDLLENECIGNID